jgi:LEA14-like dessication related protein
MSTSRATPTAHAVVVAPSAPLDIEAADSDPVKAQKPARRSCWVCCLRFWPCWVILLLVAGACAIAAQFLWFKQPHVTYDKDKVKVTLDESFTLDLPITVSNPNRYPLSFSSVHVDMFDFRDDFIGTATHEEPVTVKAHGKTTFDIAGDLKTSYAQILAIRDNCASNAQLTRVRAFVTLKPVILGIKGPTITVGNFRYNTKCIEKIQGV